MITSNGKFYTTEKINDMLEDWISKQNKELETNEVLVMQEAFLNYGETIVEKIVKEQICIAVNPKKEISESFKLADDFLALSQMYDMFIKK